MLWNIFGWDETIPEGGGLSEAQKWQTGLAELGSSIDRMGWGQPIGSGTQMMQQQAMMRKQNEQELLRQNQQKYLESMAASGASQEAIDQVQKNIDAMPQSMVPLPQTTPVPTRDTGGQNPEYAAAGDQLPEGPKMAVAPLRPGEEIQDPKGPAGQKMSEKTITVGDKEKGFWNIPTVFKSMDGQVHMIDSEDQARMYARAYEQQSGKRFPHYKTVEEATKAAEARSRAGGVNAGPLAQDPQQQVRTAPAQPAQPGGGWFTPEQMRLLKSGAMSPAQVSQVLTQKAFAEKKPTEKYRYMQSGGNIVQVDKVTGDAEVIYSAPTEAEMTERARRAKEAWPDDPEKQRAYIQGMAEADLKEARKAASPSGTGDPMPGTSTNVANAKKLFGQDFALHMAKVVENGGDFSEALNSYEKGDKKGTKWTAYNREQYKKEFGEELPPNVWRVQRNSDGKEQYQTLPRSLNMQFDKDGNLISVSDGPGGGQGFGRKANNQLESDVIESAGRVSAWNTAMAEFDRDAFTFWGRAENLWDRVRDKFSLGTLDAEEKKNMQSFTRVRASIAGLINEQIKEQGGANVTAIEWKRYRPQFIILGDENNPFEGDGPETVMNKARQAQSFEMSKHLRAQDMLDTGRDLETVARTTPLKVGDQWLSDFVMTMQKDPVLVEANGGKPLTSRQILSAWEDMHQASKGQ